MIKSGFIKSRAGYDGARTVIESVYLLSDVGLWLPCQWSPQSWLPKSANPCWKFDRGLFSLWSPPNFWKIPVAPPRVAEEWALEMKAEEESYNCFHSKAESSKGKPREATLYNTILRIARNFLETRENVKIPTHPFYHKNLDWFS